jgi:putative spermidine/putrescine transport system permease protein
VLLFLISPILAVMPLSFNSESFFTYPMPGYSLKWYEDFFFNPRWTGALKMSFLVAIATTILATVLGTWRHLASRARTSRRRRRSWRS